VQEINYGNERKDYFFLFFLRLKFKYFG